MSGLQIPSGTQLLLGGAVDFFMGYGIDAIKAISQEIPKVTEARSLSLPIPTQQSKLYSPHLCGC